MHYRTTLIVILLFTALWAVGVSAAPKKKCNNSVNSSHIDMTVTILGEVLSYLDPDNIIEFNSILRIRHAMGRGLSYRQRNSNWRAVATPQQIQRVGWIEGLNRSPKFAGYENITLGPPVRDLRDIPVNPDTSYYLISAFPAGNSDSVMMCQSPPNVVVFSIDLRYPDHQRTYGFNGGDNRDPYYNWNFVMLNLTRNRSHGNGYLYHRASFDSAGHPRPEGNLPQIYPILGLDFTNTRMTQYFDRVEAARDVEYHHVSVQDLAFSSLDRRKLWFHVSHRLNNPGLPTHCCKPNALGKRKKRDDDDDMPPPNNDLFSALRGAWVN